MAFGLRTTAALVVVLAASTATPARAQPTVAIGEVTGPRYRAFERALEEALEADGIEVGRGGATVEARLRLRGERYVVQIVLTGADGETTRLRASGSGIHAAARVAAARIRGALGAEAPTRPAPEPERRAEPEPEPSRPAPRRARGPATAITVGSLRGPQGARMRNALVRGLEGRDDATLVARSEVRAEARRGTLDVAQPAELAQAVAAAGARASVDGRVQRQGSRWMARLEVRDADGGDPVGEAIVVRGRGPTGLQRALEGEGAEQVALRAAEAPTAAREAVPALVARAARTDDHDDDDTDDDTGDATRRGGEDADAPRRFVALDVAAGARFFWRRYRYNDDLFGRLRGYDLDDGVAFHLTSRFYPGAFATNGWGAHVGLELEYDVSRLDSATAGRVFPTTSTGLLVGGLFRYPFGEKHQADFGAGWVLRRFDFDPAGPSVGGGRQNQTDVPSAGYGGVRIAAGTRLHVVAGLFFGARAALRVLYSLGGIESETWFPFATGQGFDASATLDYELPKGFVIRAGFEYQRYWMTLNPDPDSARWIAGGAVDQYFFYDLRLAWRY